MVQFRTIMEVTPDEWQGGLGLANDEIPDCLILEGSWWREERQSWRLSRLQNVRELGYPDIYWGAWKDRRIAFCMAYGAARAVEVSHIFSVLGTRLIVQIGTCGGLQSFLQAGDVVLPETASCEDGVANHLLEEEPAAATPGQIARAGDLLRERRCTVHVGPHVTFSSLFIETEEMYKAWHRTGILSVDMETASTLAAASRYGIPCVSLLVVWDDLTRGRRFTDPLNPAELEALNQSNHDVFEAALALAEMI